MTKRVIKAGSVVIEKDSTRTIYDGHDAFLALEEIVRERADSPRYGDVVEEMIKQFPKGFK